MKKEIDSKLSFSEKISNYVKVKVTKKEPDALNSLCGDPLKIDKNGNEYFIIPEHQAKYISETFPRYIVSKGYLPPDALADLNTESNSNENLTGTTANIDEEIAGEHTDLPEGTEIKLELPKKHKPRGNPNWGKKHIPPLQDTSIATHSPENKLIEV